MTRPRHPPETPAPFPSAASAGFPGLPLAPSAGDGYPWRRFLGEVLGFLPPPDVVAGIELHWASPEPFDQALPTTRGDDGMPVPQITPFQTIGLFVRGRTRHGHRPFDADPTVAVSPPEAATVELVDHANGEFRLVPAQDGAYRGAISLSVEAVLNAGTDQEQRFTRVGTVMLADEAITDLDEIDFGPIADAPGAVRG